MEQFLGKKKKAAAALAVFLFLMALCTVAAKGIYTSGMPKVSVMYPEQRTITHDIRLQGVLGTGQEYGIYVPAGLRVETVYCNVGETVEEGDVLFAVRMADLERLITDAEAEIRYQESVLQDEDAVNAQKAEEREKALARLAEDYEEMLRECNSAIDRKAYAYQQARNRRDEAQKRAAENKKKKTDESVSGGDVWDGEGSLDANEEEEALMNLLLAERQAAWELEDAFWQREDSIREWKRKLEDAESSDYTAEAERLRIRSQIAGKRQEAALLKTLWDEGGQVRALQPGILTDCQVQTGEYTTDAAAVLYSVDVGMGEAEFTLDKEALQYLSMGDLVQLEYKTSYGEKRQKQGRVAYLKKQEEGSIARVEFEDSRLIPGQNVTLKYQHVSESFDTVIPKAALHQEQNGAYYIYVVEEYQGFLGTEERVSRVDVTVLDANDSYAAVTNPALTKDSRVVVKSSGAVSDNTAVRVMKLP